MAQPFENKTFDDVLELLTTNGFDGLADAVTVTGTRRGFSRDTDVAQVESSVAEAISPALFTVDSIADNGAVSLSRTEVNGPTLTRTLKGFVSADSSLLILRMFSSDTGGNKDIGLVIGVKQ